MKRVLNLIAALCLTACASAPVRRENIARQIADDAASFNEAYAQAVSGQILLNVLRSRDRLPRTYLAMTGISDNPSWSTSQSLDVGSVPLSGGGTPLGIGEVTLGHGQERRPAYAVQPFGADTLTKTAFEPTPAYVFAHYWRSGWPRDILLLVMVERIERTDAQGHVTVYDNEANTIFDDCAASVTTGGCDYVRAARTLIGTASGTQSGIDVHRGAQLCGVVGVYGARRPVHPVDALPHGDCDPAFVVGGDTYRLRLRSLDDMIYYIGELLRAGGMRAAPGAPIEAQVNVLAAGLRGGGKGVPLFRLLPAREGVFAARVRYGGAQYVAGPAIGRSCGAATTDGVCADTADQGDRTSSVISLIAELLALNQSPEAIRAPDRLLQ
ncbi:MAG: hypothetical protein QM759_08150 [Terricaulis sp.]